ncbi:winged helix-turn-helix transcriptional regulator [Pedobacter sp. MC2016-14]|uniref:winged helix-turn-helix transcriptional regulator n=1 Tax=Pedobacter sp. MC2016-14 TaxID=2897327 RepID=UPI00351D2D41
MINVNGFAINLKNIEYYDSMVFGKAKEIVPLQVEYYLSEKGKTLLLVLEAMAK